MKKIILIVLAVMFCSACEKTEQDIEYNPYAGKYKEYRVDDSFGVNLAYVAEINGEKFLIVRNGGLAMIKLEENNEDR